MDSIQEPNKSFLFSNLILTPPVNFSGGNHFMKFNINIIIFKLGSFITIRINFISIYYIFYYILYDLIIKFK